MVAKRQELEGKRRRRRRRGRGGGVRGGRKSIVHKQMVCTNLHCPMATVEKILSLLATTSASNAWCFWSLP